MEILNEKENQERRIENMDLGYDMLKSIKELNKDVKLYNIAITHNNKIVEIGQIFKKNGVDNKFCQYLYLMINYYLTDKLEKGIEKLSDYGEFLNDNSYDNMKKNEFDSLLHRASSYLEQYRNIEKEIDEFSIEKDIKKVFQFYKEKSLEEEKKTGINSYVDDIAPNLVIYNKVIRNLGYDVSIEDNDYNYEEDTKSKEIKEYVAGITDDELKEFEEEENDKINFCIKETQNMKEYFLKKKEELEEKYKDTPMLSNAFQSKLLDYFGQLSVLLFNSNKEEYELHKEKFYNFNTEEEMVDSLGKHIAYWKDVNDFHNYDAMGELKIELEKINRNDVYAQVVKNLEEHKYDDYVNERNKKYEESIGRMRNVR